MVNSRVVAGEDVYLVPFGNPSGNAITTTINCYANAFLVRLVWLIYQRSRGCKATMAHFKKVLRDFNYGDDLLLALNRLFDPEFDLVAFCNVAKSLGIRMTSADKTGDPRFGKITDVRFLKRKFARPDWSGGRYIAQIDERTLRELTNWNPKKNGDAVLETNLAVSDRFAAHYGKEYYDEHVRRVRDAARMYGVHYAPLVWRDHIDYLY